MRGPLSRRGVSGVVAIILLVGITVVLTAVLYAIVTNIAQQVQEVPPRVLLTNVGSTGGTWKWTLSVVDVRPLSDFQIRLWINGTVDEASTIQPLTPGPRGNVTFVDTDGGGGVSEGDTVSVRMAVGYAYELFLLWRGQLVHEVTWET